MVDTFTLQIACSYQRFSLRWIVAARHTPCPVTSEHRSFCLVVTAGLGNHQGGTLQHLWFPVTMVPAGGHGAHGLCRVARADGDGCLLPARSDVQSVVQPAHPVPEGTILAFTGAAVVAGGIILMFDPGPWVRVGVAAAMAAGPAAWGVEMLLLMRVRSRRTLDVQGRATFVSLGFLAVTICLGLLAAIGEPVSPGGEPARVLLAYGIAGIGGWVGVTLIGNSYKILPFLVWYHRYRQLAGIRPVPVVSDIYSEGIARTTLVLHTAATVVAMSGALLGELDILRTGGACSRSGQWYTWHPWHTRTCAALHPREGA